MAFLISAVAFFLLLTALILVHELGHFFAARKAGVTVEEFGFGLPPRVKTLFWQGGTRFSFNWIPFGGFVRLKGEGASTDAARRAPGSFGRASIPARIIILTAGVFMNFVLALIIFTGGFTIGQWIPTYLSYEEMLQAASAGEIHLVPGVLIDQVVEGGSAEDAGLPLPSMLVAVDGTQVSDPSAVLPLQEGKQSVTYTLLTGTSFTEERQVTVPLRDGRSGVSLRAFPRELSAPARSLFEGIGLALREAKVMTVQTIVGMGQLFRSLATQGSVPEGITGIVGIAQLTHASVQDGLMTYLRLVALLNLSLAVLNILPLPALDGGRLIFVLAEAIRRRPANRTFEMTTNALGFAFLILLIVLITYHDILRLFI